MSVETRQNPQNREAVSARLYEATDQFIGIREQIRNSPVGKDNALQLGRDYLQADISRLMGLVKLDHAYEKAPNEKVNPFAYFAAVEARKLNRIKRHLDAGRTAPLKDYLSKIGEGLVESRNKPYEDEDQIVLGDKLIEISDGIPLFIEPSS